MTSEGAALEGECRVFTAFLIGARPSAYVVEAYCAAHHSRRELSGGDRFERWLVAFARHGAVVTGIADAYARLFLPAARLRKKLVVLLAILETTPPFCELIDPSHPRGVTPLVLGGGVRLAQWVVFLLLGLLICAPARLLLGTGERLGWRQSD